MVIKIHHPADIVGFEGIAYDHQAADLKSSTSGVLCPFEKSDLVEIFKRSPKLSSLLFSLSVREQIIANDRLKAVSHMSAEARLSNFLLDIIFRLRVTNPEITNEFRLPLIQTEIGDSIGLTNVSVSRTFSTMEEKELVIRTDAGIKILDETSLIELCDYEIVILKLIRLGFQMINNIHGISKSINLLKIQIKKSPSKESMHGLLI